MAQPSAPSRPRLPPDGYVARPFGATLRSTIAPIKPVLLLVAVVIVAAAVRMHDLVANPPGFYADEAAFGYNADLVLHTARDEHGKLLPVFFESFGEYKLSVYIYSQIPLTAAFGLSELSVRLTTAIYGTLTVFAVYLLTRELLERRATALLAAGVLAVLPWHIFYSRTGLGDVTTHVFFLVAGLWLFVAGTKQPRLWAFAGLAFFLALFTYRAAWVLLPPLVAVLVVLYWRDLLRRPAWGFSLVIPLFIGAAVIAGHLLTTSGDRAEDQWILGLDLGTVDTLKRFASQYGAHFTPGFLFNEERANLRHVVPGSGWLYLWQVPFIFVSAASLATKPDRPKLLVLALVLLYPLPAALTKSSPESNRTLIGAVAISIATAHGIVVVLDKVRAWRTKPRRVGAALAYALGAATASIAIFSFGGLLREYHGDYQREASGFFGWQAGARDVVTAMKRHQQDYDQVVFDGHGVFSEPYIVLRFYDCDRCVLSRWNEDGVPERYNPKRRQLFAIQPDHYLQNITYTRIDTVLHEDGGIAFILAEIQHLGSELPVGTRR